MKALLLAGAASFIVTFLLTPIIRRWAVRRGWMDLPGHRKIHLSETPRLGGVAVALGVFIPLGLLILSTSHSTAPFTLHLDGILALMAAAAFITLVGAWDDIRGLRAREKFIFQAAVATFLYWAGFRITAVSSPLGGHIDLELLAYPVTILWIVGVANAFNFIDGMDGLAAGIGFFSSITLGILCAAYGQFLIAAPLVCLAGALLGFLPHNFYPAKIFLGDSGSLLIGLLLGAGSVLMGEKRTTAITVWAPILILGLPLADTFLAILRRGMRGHPIYLPDRLHIHHKLLDMGYPQRKAIFVLYGYALLLNAAALLGAFWETTIPFVVALAGLGLVFIMQRFRYISWNELPLLNRRQRTPWQRSRFLKQIPQRLSAIGDTEELRRLSSMILKELDLDLLALRVQETLVVECRSGADAASHMWVKKVPLNAQPDRDTAELVLGRYSWKGRRQTDQDGEWVERIGSSFSDWLRSNPALLARN